MDSTTRTILIVAAVGIVAKLLLGAKVDKDADLPALMADGALLIDVRTPGEFSGGHIKGAINIPVTAITTGIEQKVKDKSKTLIVYCHSGSRSGSAKKALVRAGYTQVVNGGSLHRMHGILGQ